MQMQKFIERPPFPDIAPTKIIRSKFHIIEDDDISSENDLQQLIQLMYKHPERRFYFFSQKERGINTLMLVAYQTDSIQFLEEEFFYFRHPNFAHDYVCIREEKIQFDWEREVFVQGPMYIRVTLALTKRCERELEQAELVARQQGNNPLIMKPSFFGFGVDLLNLFKWLKKKFRTARIT